MDAIHFVKSSLYSNDIVCPKYGRSLFLSTLFSLLINVRLKWNGACRFGSQPKYHQMSSIGHESISLRLELFPSATLEHTSLALLGTLKENYKEIFRQRILLTVILQLLCASIYRLYSLPNTKLVFFES